MKTETNLKYIFILTTFLLTSIFTYPQDSSLVLHYNFDKVKSDSIFDEIGGSGCAILKNEASVKQIGKYKVLRLGNGNGYLDLGRNTGEIIKSLHAFTISTCVYLDSATNYHRNGNFIWTFANSDDMMKMANGNMFLAVSNTKYSISPTNWANEYSNNPTFLLPRGKWLNIVYSQNDSIGTIYVNGKELNSTKIKYLPQNLGKTTYNFLGKSCYLADAYLKNALYSDFRIYNKSLSRTEINSLTTIGDQLDSIMTAQYLKEMLDSIKTIFDYGARSDISLPTCINKDIVIKWESANQRYLSNDGQVRRSQRKAINVKLVAMASKRNCNLSQTYNVSIQPVISKKESIKKDSIELVLKENINYLMYNLVLPQKGIEGSKIKWKSSDSKLLSDNGEIVSENINYTTSNKTTLTAEISNGLKSKYKSFNINIQYDPEIRNSLINSGKNCIELIKVVKHYQTEDINPQKEAAAKFLIKNMDVHGIYLCKSWDSLMVELGTEFQKEDDRTKLRAKLKELYDKYYTGLQDQKFVSDLQMVNADFLISNIDNAFLTWKTPYARLLNFDKFCEYILPYRVGNENLSDWRGEFRKKYIPELLYRLNNLSDSITAEQICNGLKSYKYNALNNSVPEVSDYSSTLLSIMKLGSCRQYSLQAIYAARCLGIPVTLDYTPQWANRAWGHEWNALIPANGKPLSFGIGDQIELGKHIESNPDRIPPKVYRETFGKQKNSLAMIHGNEEIPVTFASECVTDVTKEYYNTVNISIPIVEKLPANINFAYLCVFNNREWIPVAWGKLSDRQVLFTDMNKEIVCLPVYYQDGTIFPISSPIIIQKDGLIKELKPDIAHLDTVVLSRKYQTGWIDPLGELMVGGKFQGANKVDFSDAEDLHIITSKPEPCYQIVNVLNNNEFRYFRYLSPKNSHCYVAEVEAYGSDLLTKLNGDYMTNANTKINPDLSMAFDSEPMTNFRSKEADEIWLGMKFNSPQVIKRIAYLPPSDDNCIRNHNVYELFYWNNKWISLGKQNGTNNTYRLIYNNVPKNSLLLLRNLTRGKEERIFTYKKNHQVWW